MSGKPKRRVTIKDVALRAGVSHPTVSRALNNSTEISQATKARIKLIAEEMGYASDPMMSALVRYRKSNQTHAPKSRIALVHGSHVSEYFAGFIPAAKNNATRFGYDFEHYIWDPALSDRRQSQILKSRGIKGILLGPLTPQPGLEKVNLNWKDFSVITAGRFLAHSLFDAISPNHFNSPRMALEKAYEYGYKRPGLITLDRINQRTADRLRSSFDSFMLTRPPSERIPSLCKKTEPTLSETKRWIKRHKIDVLIGHSYFMARLESNGFSTPKDIAFICINLQSTRPLPSYAGVTHNDLEIARLAITILNDNILTGSFGIPDYPKSILIENQWQDGISLPRIQ